MLIKIIECASTFLPFLGKNKTKELKEFSELITGQYEFLMGQLEKILKDYFEVSVKVREMHVEMVELRNELARAHAERCTMLECKERME
ncbi:MAG: hypothetical protein LUH22_07840 [Bacteroides sp.]|nr:hypothetical protein [Bacteroides sp.]